MKSVSKKVMTSLLVFVLLLMSTIAMSACNEEQSHIGSKLNLEGYKLVFNDEFEGGGVDLSKWQYRKNGERRGGYNHPDQVRVENGNLIMTAEYASKEYGDGWYSGMIRTVDEFKYGYYEIRCIPNYSECFWSAFWMTIDGCYDHYISQGGLYAAEIDIFETYKIHTLSTKNYITSSIHCNGSDEDIENIDSHRVVKAYVPNLRDGRYTTFGLLWTEKEYVFYVNGKETGRTSFGLGTSMVPEYVVVSLEIPNEISLSRDTTTEYIVDYVRIYQLEG